MMEQKMWPLKLGIATLVITIFPWSYWVYGLGKIIVCSIALYYCYKNYVQGKKQVKIFWYFLIVGAIFNPILPLHLFFNILWIIVDVAVIAFFWSYYKLLKHTNKKTLTIHPAMNKSMTYKSSFTEQIQHHLEFLGYTSESFEDAKADVLLFRSENHSNLVVRVVDDLVMVSARYTTKIKKKANSEEAHLLFNETNSQVVVSRWYFEIKDEMVVIVIESFCFGYVKSYFGKMIDTLENDIRNHMQKFVELES